VSEEKNGTKKKKDEEESSEAEVSTENESKEKKTIVVGAADIQTLVLDSVSELMDKGVLAESDDGKKIDLKENIEDKEKVKKKKQNNSEPE